MPIVVEDGHFPAASSRIVREDGNAATKNAKIITNSQIQSLMNSDSNFRHSKDALSPPLKMIPVGEQQKGNTIERLDKEFNALVYAA